MMEGGWRGSYHTHNHYCDGAGTIDDVVQAALAAGLEEIGISSHAPLPFVTDWAMPQERLASYLAEVRAVRERYVGQIRVLLGLEVDFIPDERVLAFQRTEVFPLDVDYFIGSVHFLGTSYPPVSFDGKEESFVAILQEEYGGDTRAMLEEYYRREQQVLQMPKGRIVGHLDRIARWNDGARYYRTDTPWHMRAVDETLDAIAASGHLLELNTSGWRKGMEQPFPARPILERCRNRPIPVILSSDAHSPQEVTWGFERGHALLTEVGITPVASLWDRA